MSSRLDEQQLASGTPTPGYVATATGTGTAEWAEGGGGAATGYRSPVQSVNSGSASSGTRVPVLAAAPTNGNKLILVSLAESTHSVSSVVTTNVTWALLAQTTAGQAPVIEIWIGTVAASASATTTVTYSGSGFHNAVLSEWTGLAGTLDASALRYTTTDGAPLHPIPELTPTVQTALVICGVSTTSNGTFFTAFTGSGDLVLMAVASCFVAYGFPGINLVYGAASGGAAATSSGITVSIV